MGRLRSLSAENGFFPCAGHRWMGLVCAVGLFSAVLAGGPPPEVTWDTAPDTWVATDALGRSLPTGAEVGPPRPEKQVAIFYFLWLGRHGSAGPFDISKILTEAPAAIDDPQHPLWGPMHVPHHWGESIFGYYVAEDEAVLAKHAQMLTDAGVDAVIFDVTNQLTYPESWRALCRVWDRIRRSGQRVPGIAFLCPFWDPGRVVRQLERELYGPGLYPELWYRWEGKPLILADPGLLGGAPGKEDPELERIRSRFTFRKPQPDYFVGPTGPDQWGWLEVFPQHAFTNRAGTIEEVPVGVAQNAVDGRLSVLSNPRSHGRSFHAGQPAPPGGGDGTGRNFAEQWTRALALDPMVVFVTGWNEWIAGRFTTNSGFYADGVVSFVDQFDPEHSRDIEPMRGGHGDNYYYQLVANVRRFKGARTVEPVRPAPIRVDGRFEDWAAVGPEFRDTIGDPIRRDHVGWDRKTRYVDDTGRNDIVQAKVSADRSRLYFYAATREPLTPCTDTNWMVLYLDVDGCTTNGWLGYDFVLNRHGVTPKATVLERHGGRGHTWTRVADVSLRLGEREFEVAVPLRALGLRERPAVVHFKWADNAIRKGEAVEFTLHGDAAPNDRFHYRAVLTP